MKKGKLIAKQTNRWDGLDNVIKKDKKKESSTQHISKNNNNQSWLGKYLIIFQATKSHLTQSRKKG